MISQLDVALFCHFVGYDVARGNSSTYKDLYLFDWFKNEGVEACIRFSLVEKYTYGKRGRTLTTRMNSRLSRGRISFLVLVFSLSKESAWKTLNFDRSGRVCKWCSS